MTNSDSSVDATEIDVRQAIEIAKTYVQDLFFNDGGKSPTLEEVWYDEVDHIWCVTVGIRHRRETTGALGMDTHRIVDYKTVRISATDGKVLSVKLHDTAA